MKRIAFIALLMASTNSVAKPLNRVLAVVNDSIITEQELEQAQKKFRVQFAEQQQTLPPADQFKKEVLDKLILDNIQSQLAQRNGILVDDAELDHTIESLATRQHMNLNEFRQSLAKNGLDYKEFREDIRKEMMIGQLHQKDILAQVTLADSEVDEFLRSHQNPLAAYQFYHLAHAMIPWTDEASKDKVREQAIRFRARLNQGDSFDKLTAMIKQQQGTGGDLGWQKSSDVPTLFATVVPQMNPGDVKGPIESQSGLHFVTLIEKKLDLPQHALKEFEKVHVRHILIAVNNESTNAKAKAEAEALYKQLAAGKSFEALAQSHSQDAGSSAKGGDMGWVPLQAFVPAFVEAIEPLALNQLSKPFRTPFGWHIAQVLERKVQDDPRQIVREQAANFLRQKKFAEKVSDWQQLVRSEAFVKIYES